MTTSGSPVDVLPSELLADIFAKAQPRKRSRYKIPFEVDVSHVCSRWRDVALDAASLWTSIDIYSTHALAWVPQYLERSKALPVDVRFDVWEWDRWTKSAVESRSLLPVVDITLAHTDRWKSFLLLTFHPRSAKTILSHMSSLSGPTLQDLRIIVDNPDYDFEFFQNEEESIILPLMAGGVPKLISLETDGVRQLPPLGTLTVLQLHASLVLRLNYANLVVIVESAPSLVTLVIRGPVDTSQWPDHHTPVFEMGSLRSLLFSNETGLPTQFFSSFSTPQLQSLWLDCSRPIIVRGLGGHNLFPRLQFLTLQGCDFTDIASIAQDFPSISHLHLAYCNIFYIRYLKDALLEHDCQHWPLIKTIAVRTARDHHVSKLLTVLEDVTETRYKNGTSVGRILLDHNVFSTISKSAALQQHTRIEELSPSNYADPLWITVHKDTWNRS